MGFKKPKPPKPPKPPKIVQEKREVDDLEDRRRAMIERSILASGLWAAAPFISSASESEIASLWRPR